MPPAPDLIDTIVIVMMENRSFDHMLGYLSLPAGGAMKLDGIVDDPAWRQRYANPGKVPDHHFYEAMPQQDLHIPDPPHERSDIKVQLGEPTEGVFPMKGFVQSAHGVGQVMHYYTSETVPIMDFFARNFLVCDRWFAPLPAGTQANRLMAMCGYTEIDTNVGNPLEFPDQKLVYDWLDQKKINWRVYHQGIFPFLSMMPRLYEKIAGSPMFRRSIISPWISGWSPSRRVRELSSSSRSTPTRRISERGPTIIRHRQYWAVSTCCSTFTRR
jgi:phospholipase C